MTIWCRSTSAGSSGSWARRATSAKSCGVTAARARAARARSAGGHADGGARARAARPGLTVIHPGSEAAGAGADCCRRSRKTLHRMPSRRARGETVDRKHAGAARADGGIRPLGCEHARSAGGAAAGRVWPRGSDSPAALWQALARGEDVRPLVPDVPEERFDRSLELDWPIEGLEPLSFVLTRLLEPLSTRLEQRDRGAAVLSRRARLAAPAASGCRRPYGAACSLPVADPRRADASGRCALLDLDRIRRPRDRTRHRSVIDPTPGRILQHTLFTRAHPTPEQLSTLLARLAR